MSIKDLEKKARDVRKELLRITFEGNGIHISSSMSIADILTVLYFKELRLNISNLKDENRDKFILSKGHGASALYAVLASRGILSNKVLNSYGKEGTSIGAHPETGVAGIELATGALGHGLTVGLGFALAAKLNKSKSRTFVLVSDGECQEGSIWEAALFAGHNKLDNLVVVVDYNKLQALGRVKNIGNLEPFSLKWRSFGWGVVEVDGNDIKSLTKTLGKIPLNGKKPTAIIAHTVAGKGVSFLENRLKWHYMNLNEEQYLKAIKELSADI